jgi:hypothetical protein
MAVSERTRKALWSRSGNRCAYTGCAQVLVADAERGDALVIGHEAHIVARRPNGPRGSLVARSRELDALDNLILLCPNHHRLVDGDRARFPVDVLEAMKKSHEFAVRAALAGEDSDAAGREALMTTVDEWAVRAQIERWDEAMSAVAWTPRPRILRDDFKELQSLRVWLRERPCILSEARTGLALRNFLAVLDDLVPWFDATVRDADREVLVTHLRYKDLDRWDTKTYNRLIRIDRENVAAVRNLTYELTRAANYICDVVRSELDPRFRVLDRAATLVYGPRDDLVIQTRRPEYRVDERTPHPYPGYKQFLKVGPRRDFWTRDFEN